MHFADLDVAVIFTDSYKQTLVDQWRTFPVADYIVLPIALADHRYTVVQEKNSRCFTVGNDFARICEMYPRYETFARPAIETLIARYADCYDAFGWNGGEDGVILGDHRRGSVPIATLAPWSASVHVSGVASIGFALAECFAAGIPVLSTPKYQLPRDGSWLEIQTVEEMTQVLDELLTYPNRARELGQAGQTMFRKNFGIDQYREKLKLWLNGLM